MAISTKNSTSTPLNAADMFTGQVEDVLEWSSIFISCATDQNGTLAVKYSSNGSNFDFTDSYTITGGEPFFQSVEVKAKYLKVVLTNGATNQTFLRLQTLLKNEPTNVNIDNDLSLTTNYATSSMSCHQTGAWAVSVSSAPSTVVTANDLDIRNLNTGTDSVTCMQGGGWTAFLENSSTGMVNLLSLTNTAVNIGGNMTTLLISIYIMNNAIAKRYVKFYNKQDATSADTPDATYCIPTGSVLTIPMAYPIAFTTACSMRATVNAAANDNTAPSADDVAVMISYYQ